MVKPFQAFNSCLLIRTNYPEELDGHSTDPSEMELNLYFRGSCVRKTSWVFLWETTTHSVTCDTLRLQANHVRQCRQTSPCL